MRLFPSLESAAAALGSPRILNVEMLPAPRPSDERRRIVYDHALRSRLAALTPHDDVLLVAASAAAAESLRPLHDHFSRFPVVPIVIANPQPWHDGPPGNTPFALQWDPPHAWLRIATSDRWARIKAALTLASLLSARLPASYLAFPAHDSVWGSGLLPALLRLSRRHTVNGVPAAVSPLTARYHSAVPGAHIPPDIIRLANVALRPRDSFFPLKVMRNQTQGYWGKMGLIPFAMAADLVAHADDQTWEDDLELDRIMRVRGYESRSLWVRRASMYRQALPVFTQEDLAVVLNRLLHYSANIPPVHDYGPPSYLRYPTPWPERFRMKWDARFAHDVTLTSTLIERLARTIRERLGRYEASWCDWGAYRYVARPGFWRVEVWQHIP